MTNDHDDDDVDGELLAELAAGLAPIAPAASLHDRLLKSIASESRFADRFAARVAAIIDVTHEAAQKLLDAVDVAASWTENPLPGMELFHIAGGPRVADAIVGFVRMPPGAVFPEHEHNGDEVVLVIQGGYVDSDGVAHRAGEEHRMPAGSRHSFTASPGPDLVYLGVTHKGFTIGDTPFGPDSPEM